MSKEKKTSEHQQGHAPLAGVSFSSHDYIGYATYLNTRVSPVFGSDDITELLSMVRNAMSKIPKLGNCSFIIEPNLRTEGVFGFDSYDEYSKHG